MLEKLKREDYEFYLRNGRKIESINNITRIELDAKKMRYGDNYMPLGYTRYSDGSILLQALAEFEGLALDFINKFKDLFGESAFDYIYKNIAEYMKREFNLAPDIKRYKESSVYYELADKNKLSSEKKQSSTVKFDGLCEYEIIDKYVFINKDSPDVFFGTLIDNKIVSVAKKNNKNEIAVGTHENYRGKGCAVSNVVAIAEYILNNGEFAAYCTDGANIASQKTAQSAGFTEISREKLFWFRN